MRVYTEQEYKNAFSELVVILQNLPQMDLIKIPVEEVEYYIENKNNDYKFSYDYYKPLQEQVISDLTKILLANLFIYYLADNKEELIAKENEKGIYNDLFNNKNVKEEINNDIINDDKKMVVIQEKNIIIRIYEKILYFLKKKK